MQVRAFKSLMTQEFSSRGIFTLSRSVEDGTGRGEHQRSVHSFARRDVLHWERIVFHGILWGRIMPPPSFLLSASQRATARMLGVDHETVRKDLGEKSPLSKKEAPKSLEKINHAGEKSPPSEKQATKSLAKIEPIADKSAPSILSHSGAEVAVARDLDKKRGATNVAKIESQDLKSLNKSESLATNVAPSIFVMR